MTESGSSSLADLKLPELKKMAAGMGIKGTSAMRKGDLIAAISGGVNVPTKPEHKARTSRPRKRAEVEPQLPVEAPEHVGPEQPKEEKAEPESPTQQSQPRVDGEGISRNRRRRERNKERDRAAQEATNEEVGER